MLIMEVRANTNKSRALLRRSSKPLTDPLLSNGHLGSHRPQFTD
jgi:hypothetical protein